MATRRQGNDFEMHDAAAQAADCRKLQFAGADGPFERLGAERLARATVAAASSTFRSMSQTLVSRTS